MPDRKVGTLWYKVGCMESAINRLATIVRRAEPSHHFTHMEAMALLEAARLGAAVIYNDPAKLYILPGDIR